MKIKPKNASLNVSKQDLYSSGQQQSNLISKSSHKKLSNNSKVKNQFTKIQTIKKQQTSSSGRAVSNPSRPKPPPNDLIVKIQPSDIRLIDKMIQQKHGKILTSQQMTSLKKQMHKQTFNQPNLYNQINFNAGQRNQYKDCKKKALSSQDLTKLKQHFLTIIRIVNKGQRNKYTLRDIARQFNLDGSAYLQMKRQFQNDPDILIHLKKTSQNNQQHQEGGQIQNILKKRIILQKLLQKNPILTKQQLSQKIVRFTKNQQYFPQSQIQRLLQRQGYNWRSIVKYPQSRNFKQNLIRRKVFCQKVNYILTQTNYKVYFLGIMNFNSFMFKNQGWTKDQYLIDPIIDQSFSLVALTQRSGQGTWKFQKQLYKQEIFGETYKVLFDNLLQQSFQPKYIVVDFRLYKYQSILKKSRKKYDIQSIWIPPFSYLLNPLEFWFQQIKNTLLQRHRDCSEQFNFSVQNEQIQIKDIYDDLKQIFTEKYNNNFDFTKYFQQTSKYHQKALKLQKF